MHFCVITTSKSLRKIEDRKIPTHKYLIKISFQSVGQFTDGWTRFPISIKEHVYQRLAEFWNLVLQHIDKIIQTRLSMVIRASSHIAILFIEK